MESSNGSGLGFKLSCGDALMQASFRGNDLLPEVMTDPEDWAFFDCIWRLAKPSRVGNGNPWINPAKDSSIARMWWSRVLVFDAEKDYKELLERSGSKGRAEVMEAKEEDNVFHPFNTTC